MPGGREGGGRRDGRDPGSDRDDERPPPDTQGGTPGERLHGEANIAGRLNRTQREIADAIHAVKNQPGWRGLGGNRNPDVSVDPVTGEVYPQLPDGTPADDSIGNLFDYLK
ncbi:hypothetical protein ACI2K4_24110 [Micromonospora sp. NPDC050397]|uniref:hypothetical protein n=1 Tax=Micromonospora sp. NPDC050397 TaxID=3364279 RepID=UPI00384DDEDF